MSKLKNGEEIIDSSRISVVIQGLTHYVENDKGCMFYQCIESIKKHLPYAEIIVSTWENQDCDESVVDKVLYNNEPKSIISDRDENYQWNFNKMVVSTKNGIIASNREYVLKFRMDLSLVGTRFFIVTHKDNIPDSFNKFKIFQNPINISNIFTKTPFSQFYYFLYHLSDIVQFGKRENLLDLWNRNLLDESTLKHSRNQNFFFNHFSYHRLKMSPEQALMIGWLNSYGYKINLPYTSYISRSGLYLFELVLSTNFNTLNWDQTDILYPKRFLSDPEVLEKYVYQAEEINYLYREYGFLTLNKRFLHSLKIIYIDKFFSKFFWDLLCKKILLSILPSELYSTLKTKWRAVINKKE
ncbi:WavE lipopolysaccharide synthesis family protein [Acinetobacter sp. BSP-28]|uniref:WavE lipopolysaccharide synthesis family protein n=1 Tax=Acinetobacter sp. BSP-28 TaxID=3344661 RepID=UPI0037701B8F